MSKSKLSSAQFVVLYMDRGGDLESISSELGVGQAAVYQRVMKMRKAGVRLPIKKKSKRYNVKELNQLIRERKGK